MDLTIAGFESFISENCHTKFGGNWKANKGETEGGGDTPLGYIITKYPGLNRVNLFTDFNLLPCISRN